MYDALALLSRPTASVITDPRNTKDCSLQQFLENLRQTGNLKAGSNRLNRHQKPPLGNARCAFVDTGEEPSASLSCQLKLDDLT